MNRAADFRVIDFRPEHYGAMAEVHNLTLKEYPVSEGDFRFRDETRDPKCRQRRLVILDGEAVIGFGEYDQHTFMYHPRKFLIDLYVRPDRQGRGAGRLLYDRVLEMLRPLDPIGYRTMAREDLARSIRFLTDRGFQEERRIWESRLDPTRFDFAPYAGSVESVLAQGIEIRTYRELMNEPEHLARLSDLDWEATQDVPTSEPVTRPPEDTYRKMTAENPRLLPDGFFFAVDRGQYAGLTSLWAVEGSTDLTTGFTGVARAWRRRGIALALKLKAVEWARSRGCTCIKTWNDSKNRPMLSINEAMGFVRQPAWIWFVKDLADRPDAG